MSISLNIFLNKKIVVKQIRSQSKLGRKQNACLIGLGLRGIDSTSNLMASPDVLGMVRKVSHIIEVKLA